MSDASIKRLPSEEEELIEEALSEIYKCFEDNKTQVKEIESILNQEIKHDILKNLEARRYVTIQGGNVVFSAEGRQIAESITRRQRLSERLLRDVLNVSDQVIDPVACQWEHVLSVEVTEAICTLLGHPTECPHGFAIPRGDCCKNAASTVTPVVLSLINLSAGAAAEIVYVLVRKNPEIHRLLNMGLTPGARIRLLQRTPTFVIEVGESQLAFDASIAQSVFVRMGKKH